MRNFISAVLCWLLVGSGLFVSQPLVAQSALRKDSGFVSIKSLDKSRIDGYRSQKEFMYATHTGRQMSGWDIFWSWFWDQYYRLMRQKGFRTSVEILIWVLGIGITAYAIIRLVGTEKIMLWMKGETAGAGAFTISEDDIHGIDFAQSIFAAEAKQDYREAIRLHYLQSLKKLADRSLILWSPSKTNIDYASELSGSGYAQGFHQLTRFYEYAWYGEFMPPIGDYRKISAIFQQFNEGVRR